MPVQLSKNNPKIMRKNIPYLIKMVTKNLLYGFVVQFLFLTTLMAIDTKAQITSIDKTFIRLSKKETPIKEVFNNLETETAYVFVYPDDLLSGKKPISLSGHRRSVYDILADIAKESNLKFKQVNNAIYVGEENSEETNLASIENELIE